MRTTWGAAAWMAGLCLVVAGCGGGSGGGTEPDSCEAPLVACGDTCVDTRVDTAHCGECDRACDSGESCIQGSCRPESEGCPAGTERCRDRCVDTDADAAHCGRCDNACPAGVACEAGVCACPGEELACDGTCVDPDSDPSHCGRCDHACPTGASCEAGTCVCPEGQDECDGACVDRKTDPAHCGGCGNDCVEGMLCDDGSCACPADRKECEPGTCSDLETDSLHCGSCSNSCDGGTVCTEGECVCPPGLLDCDGTCVDPLTDAAHCGACGIACADGLICREGGCAAAPCGNGLGLPGPARLDAGAVYYGFALGDLDDDGDPDILVGDEEGEGALRWFENLGGAFAGQRVFADPPAPLMGLLIADLDGEAPADVVGVSTSYYPNAYLFLRGATGEPRLVHLEWPRRAVPFIPRDPRAADLDADGDLDLVLSDDNRYEILVARNLGDGSFEVIEDAVPLPPDSRPGGLAIGDMDGNGYDDLVVAQGHKLYTIKTVGPFQFVPGTVYENGSQHGELALGDFDGDGDLDVVLDEGHIARNDGTGNFTDYGVLQERQTLAVRMATGDVDGDGLVDFVGPRFGTFDVMFNRGDHFTTYHRGLGTGAAFPHLADVNGDGSLDLVVGTVRTRWVDVIPNPGDGRFPAPYRLEHLYGNAPALALGEIDDYGGRELLVIPGERERMYLIHFTPDGPLVEETWPPAAYSGLALVDGDDDPQSEYATIDPALGTVAFLEGWPPAQFFNIELGPGLKSLVSLDVDGDGARDLITLEDSPEPGLRVLLAPLFAGTPILPLSGGAIPLEALPADLDGDGDQDLLVASDQSLHVLENDAGTLVDARQYGIVPLTLAVGDLDGDGRPDLAIADADEDRIVIQYQTPDGSFESGPVLPHAAARLAIADLDADGWNDLVALTDSLHALTVFPGSPGGPTPSSSWPALSYGSTALLVTDLDGDLRPDVFAIDGDSGMSYASGCLP